MSKRKYILLSTLTLAIACLIVILHIPFLSLILGGEKVFQMRGAFLFITPCLILIVSILASIILTKLGKQYKNSNK